MGRKKQKVRWTTVEDGFFESEDGQLQQEEMQFLQQQPQPQRHNSESSATSSHNGYMKYRGGAKYPRRAGGFWSNPALPPRFERSKAAEYMHAFDNDSSCETEELPDGFTKIRSKNLDVLFKKDYYAQRMLLQQQQLLQQQENAPSGMPATPTSAMSSEHGDDEDEDPISEEPEPLEVNPEEAAEAAPQTEAGTTHPKVIEEAEQAPKKSSKINSNATPFYPSSYLANAYVPPAVSTASTTDLATPPNGRPNLFLYSPASNTMIPCEEIIIPNAVMPGSSADVYQGPSNIYLAFPMEAGGSSSGGGVSPSSPGTMSTIATPPQVQSPHNGAAATPPVVQYDHYGVPYTSYTASTMASAASESSSAESTGTPQSPPDLSVYNPTNWVAASEAASYYGGQHQQYYPYYYNYNYSGGRGGHYQQYYVENSNLTSSAGESPMEDRSEGEDVTPTTATTTTSNSPKKEASKEAAVIPGLPVHNLKRPTKKRRKKKAPAVTASAASDSHRGSSSSEANVVQMAAAAITILQRKDSEDEAILDDEQPPKEAEAAQIAEEQQAELEADEEVLIVEKTEFTAVVDDEEEKVEAVEAVEVETATEVKPSKPRRRRGARKSEKKKLAAAAQIAEAEEAVEQPQAEEIQQPQVELPPPPEIVVDSHQWETIPQHIIESDDKEGWETTKPKKSIKASVWPVESFEMEAREATPPLEPEAAPEVEAPPQLEVDIPELSSASAPTSRKSTLKRPNRKKRSSLDNGLEAATAGRTVLRPILISDRDFDVASAVAAQRRFNKSAFEVLDEAKIRDMASRPAFDTLYVSDIGHGMIGGPISSGRFGLGKYIPPDRSDEIYPIPKPDDAENQDDDSAAAAASEPASEAAAAASQKSIIKTMMEEVMKTTNVVGPSSTLERLTTHIRDAKRFSEISTNLVHSEDSCSASAAASIPVPEAIVNGLNKSSASIDLDLD